MKQKRRVRGCCFALTLLLTALLCGCGHRDGGTETAKPAGTAEPAAEASPAEPAADSGRKDGERFEAVIMLEGMEETVGCEHVRNEALGFELDYEYESMVRYSESDAERFVSCYEEPGDPWNYLEIRRETGKAELVADAVRAALSADFAEVTGEEITLERAGACLRLDASGSRENASALQTVYIIPAPDGCLVAAAHCTFESAEGFGARFACMMDTLALIGG